MTKKVGIVTYHHYYNYGTALQAFALQKAIDSIEGFQSEIIDYRAYEEKRLSKLQLILVRLRRLPVYLFEWKRVRALRKYASVLSEKNPKFDCFFKDILIQSKKTYNSYDELKTDNLDYDVLVTGSDQTWSPKIGFFPAFFLEFGKKNALRIAYAPSIGVSKLSVEEEKYLNLHLQSFEAISCREKLGTDILSKVIKGKEIINVLDPTFLLTKDDWDEIVVKPSIKGDYILCYFIGHKTYYRDIAQQLSNDLGLPLYFIPVSWQDMGKGYNLVADTGPREFLGLISGARLVLTDSFHGTAFSINYRKSFYAFTKIEGGKNASDNSRLFDILSKLHLEDRLFYTVCSIKFTDVDYTKVEMALEVERKKSFSFLKDSLIDKRICSLEECTGCMACQSVCTHGAIKFEKDLMGFCYPKKIMEQCVGCGLCENVCPNNTLPEYNQACKAYVATASNHEERQTSTSGGIASILARYIVNKDGIVYGCTSKRAAHICHIRISKEEDVILLKGSKYVQSDISEIMPQVKDDLKNGLEVLFIGTPCQVAGLKSFLRKPYKNLFTVDFVCHGVPSQQILNDALKNEYSVFDKQQLKVDFRFKEKSGKSHYGIKLIDNEGKCVYKESYPKSKYISGFLGGMFYRESCYQCHYTKDNRVSDITLGDYWDRELKYTAISKGKDGLSMVMINTDSGKNLFDCITEKIVFESITTNAIVARNAQLRQPMRKNKYYEAFRNIYSNKGYNEEAEVILNQEITRVRKAIAINIIARRVKQIKYYVWQRK